VVGVGEEGSDLTLGVVLGAGAPERRVVARSSEEGVAGVEALGLAPVGGLRGERVEEGRRHDAGHRHVVGVRHVAVARRLAPLSAVLRAGAAVPVLAATQPLRAPAVLRRRREGEPEEQGRAEGFLPWFGCDDSLSMCLRC
jgi:hypothetical protein